MADKKKKTKVLLTKKERMNRALNFRIIQAAWKIQKGSYGENDIKNNKNNFDNLYGTLEKSRQSIRMISTMEGEFDKELVEKWADRVTDKTGIPKKYLTGEEVILVNEEWEKDIEEKFEEFVTACDFISENREKAKDRPIYASKEKLRKALEKLKGEEAVKEAEAIVVQYKIFEENLKEEVGKILRLDNFNTIADKDVVRVFYFIKTGQHYDRTLLARIPEIMGAMNNVHTNQLLDLGSEALDKYIEKLEEQLQLAKAVRTVARDIKHY